MLPILGGLSTETRITKEGHSYYINWVNHPIDRQLYKHIVKYVNTKDDYGPFNTDHLTQLVAYLHKHNSLPSHNIEDLTQLQKQQLHAIRTIVLKHKIIRNYHKLDHKIDRIKNEYTHTSILSLSTKYDFAPLHLLKKILTILYNKSVVHRLTAGITQPQTELNERDLQQYLLAEQHDSESAINQQQAKQRADTNEDLFVEYFRSSGIKLKTQNDIKMDIASNPQLPILTPDILFIDTVYINNAKIAWIDYKDYVAVPSSFLHTKNVQQAEKYFNQWGDGAIAYRLSYVEDAAIPHAMLLDASGLDIPYVTI